MDRWPERGSADSSVDYEFATSARAGAILLLPQCAMSVKLISPEQFRAEAMKSALNWYEFARKRYGLQQRRDLDRSLHVSHHWFLQGSLLVSRFVQQPYGYHRENPGPTKRQRSQRLPAGVRISRRFA
ncbi:hypothetical protein EV363DRAFT_1461064 [Boletus edulis]|nr:hypothetical protein EV363DRAFT_1461064 [Boletus edulis]